MGALSAILRAVGFIETRAMPSAPATDSLADLIRVLEKRAISGAAANSIGARIDAAISSRAAAATAVSNADYTAARAALLDAAITGRLGKINSIQEGTVQVAADVSTGTATITSVAVARSILLRLGEAAGTSGAGSVTKNDLSQAQCRLSLTNATTVTATRLTSLTSVSDVVGFMVVEFAT